MWASYKFADGSEKTIEEVEPVTAARYHCKRILKLCEREVPHDNIVAEVRALRKLLKKVEAPNVPSPTALHHYRKGKLRPSND